MPKPAPLPPVWEALRVALRDGDATAQAEVERAVKQDRLDPGLKIALDAQLLMAKGKFDDAKKRLENAAKMRKLGPPELLIAAHVAIESGEIDRAAKLFADLKKEGGLDDPRYPAGLAAVAIAEGRAKDALGLLKQALTADPKQWHARYLLGMALGAAGDPKAARAELFALTQSHPGFIPAWLGWAGYSIGLKKGAEAAAALAPIALAHPEIPELQFALADCRRASGDVDGALAALTPVASRSRDVGFLLDYAEMALEAHRAPLTRAALDTVAVIDSASVRAQVVKARLAEHDSDYTGAVVAYRRAIELDPKDLRARNGLGLLLSKETPVKDWAAAAIELEAACGLADPAPLAPLLNLAILRASEGNKDLAADLAKKVLARRPKDPGVLEQAERIRDWSGTP